MLFFICSYFITAKKEKYHKISYIIKYTIIILFLIKYINFNRYLLNKYIYGFLLLTSSSSKFISGTSLVFCCASAAAFCFLSILSLISLACFLVKML